jgi:hypothetical protein
MFPEYKKTNQAAKKALFTSVQQKKTQIHTNKYMLKGSCNHK